MRVADLALVGALVAACGSEPAPHHAPETIVAHVTAAAGDVRIRRDGIGAWEPLSVGAEIGSSDQVQALAHASATLVFVETRARVAVAPNTTMQFDGSPRPRAVTGQLVAKVDNATRPSRFEVAIPHATLVVTATTEKAAEAAIDVTATETTIEMHAGTAAVIPSHGSPIAIPEHERRRFDPAGKEIPSAKPVIVPALASITLGTPADLAHVRVRHEVTMQWAAVEDATRYHLTLVAGSLSRELELAAATTTVPISTGHYTWSVRALRGTQVIARSREQTFDAEVHGDPPPLVIEQPAAGAAVLGPKLHVIGTSVPGCVIEVNGASVVADARGRFAMDIAIVPGLSNLVFSAHDDLGNRRRISRSVLWE